MLLKHIEKLVKKTGTIEAIQTADGVWVNNGYVAAPLFVLRELTEEQAFQLFSIPEKKRSEYTFTRRGPTPDEADLLMDDWAGEEALQGIGPVIVLGGENAVPFFSSRGVIWAVLDDLQPFVREDAQTTFYARWQEGAAFPVLAAKSGMLLKGLIYPLERLPLDTIFGDWLDRLQRETARVRKFGYADPNATEAPEDWNAQIGGGEE